MEGSSKHSRQLRPIKGRAEQQICLVRRPVLGPHSLPFLLLVLNTVTCFCHPRVWWLISNTDSFRDVLLWAGLQSYRTRWGGIYSLWKYYLNKNLCAQFHILVPGCMFKGCSHVCVFVCTCVSKGDRSGSQKSAEQPEHRCSLPTSWLGNGEGVWMDHKPWHT